MKPTIDYNNNSLQMRDLLREMGVSFRKDFTTKEQEALRKQLINYMKKPGEGGIKIDLKKFFLVLNGPDEAGYLYEYVK